MHAAMNGSVCAYLEGGIISALAAGIVILGLKLP